MSSGKNFCIDFAHGEVVCPDLLMHLPPVRYVSMPPASSRNEMKAGAFKLFEDVLHKQFPNIICSATSNFLSWLRGNTQYDDSYPANDDSGEGLTRHMAVFFCDSRYDRQGFSLQSPLFRLRFVRRYLDQFPEYSLPCWAWRDVCALGNAAGLPFPLPTLALAFLSDNYACGDTVSHDVACVALKEFLLCNRERLRKSDMPQPLEYLLRPDPSIGDAERRGISILFSALRQDVSDTSAPTQTVIEDFADSCLRDLPEQLWPPAWQLLAWERQGLLPKTPGTLSAPYIKQRRSSSLSLLGWGDGTMGIGEDQRTLQRALNQAGVASSPVSVTPLVPHCATPYDWNVPIRSEPDGLFSVICLAAQDIYRLWARSPAAWWSGRHHIGLCPWELPEWPDSAKVYVQMLDEIWAPSRFVAEAFKHCGKPVTLLPHAIIPPKPDGDLRKELGISHDAVVFLTAFDAGASCIRKNPLAVVRAFNASFAGKNYPVRLIVKSMYAERDMACWKALHDENACGDSVLFINEVLSPERNTSLLNTCDAFVSLHRSEGFGRLLAEAMGLGKLLIASNFGGNTDFTLPSTACPVDGHTISVQTGEYLFGEGQHWFEPSIEHAAHWMRFFVENKEASKALAENGRTFIETHHSPEVIGRRARAALEISGWRQ